MACCPEMLFPEWKLSENGDCNTAFVVDLGSGIGSSLLLSSHFLFKKKNVKKLTAIGIEAQEISYSLLSATIAELPVLSAGSAILAYHADLRRLKEDTTLSGLMGGQADLVQCNPPYNSNLLSSQCAGQCLNLFLSYHFPPFVFS